MKNNNFTRGSGIFEGFLAKQRANLANKFITKSYRDGKILDVGCGSYPYFLNNTKFKEKYGIDPSLDSLKIKEISLKNFDVSKQNLPFDENYFDVITMLAVFEHIDKEKLNFVLKEIFRVLKKDGIFIITTPAPWSDKLLHLMARLGLISKVEIHEHKHNLNQASIKESLKTSGFKKQNIRSGFFEVYMNMWFTAIK